MGLDITLGGARSNKVLIDFSTEAGIATRALMQAKMDSPTHIKLIEDNIDDHPELNILLLQMNNIREDIALLRSYFSDVEGEIEKKLTKNKATDTPLSAEQALSISANTKKAAFTPQKGDYGDSALAFAHAIDKDSGAHSLQLSVAVKGKTPRDTKFYSAVIELK